MSFTPKGLRTIPLTFILSPITTLDDYFRQRSDSGSCSPILERLFTHLFRGATLQRALNAVRCAKFGNTPAYLLGRSHFEV
ncbi:hypothetical protein BDV96DRAFT_270883 [Lophiotrema nucula]|uniref:Uncharacterized protein n=1 Tax=Lophiotrema nucula TaxID=690887 RepID=A0A6A5ZQU7_9PLEO|nr:hypothetical protein BDV96DRAFT_270883 [Lophiotrema nucula]